MFSDWKCVKVLFDYYYYYRILILIYCRGGQNERHNIESEILQYYKWIWTTFLRPTLYFNETFEFISVNFNFILFNNCSRHQPVFVEKGRESSIMSVLRPLGGLFELLHALKISGTLICVMCRNGMAFRCVV